MFSKVIYVVAAIMLALALISPAYGFSPGSPDLLAWWTCNEGEGAVVGDVSGYGRDGTFVFGDPAWVEGVSGSAVELVGPTLVEVAPLNVELTQATMAGWIKPNGPQPDWSSVMMTRTPGLATGFNVLGYQLAYHWNDDSASWSYRGGDMIAEADWTFAAVTVEPDKATFYVNGVPGSVNAVAHGPCMWNSNIYLGGDGTDNWVARRMNGALDDVALFNRALTADEIIAVMEGVEQIDLEVGFTMKPPVIDGEVDYVWEDVSAQSFVPLEDPADGSGTWKVLYDAENLYVMVDITDDSLQNDSASAWQDDSVEIYFDGGNTKLDTPLSGDDHQYTFGWTADDIQGTNITGYTDGIEQAQVTTATGWRIEVKMPWMSIWGVMPGARDLIGIDCYYNDDDDGGDSREGKMLSFSAVEGWNDASQWATAMLAVAPAPVDPGTDGLVAQYSFENDVNDSSGNGFNGTIVGNATFAQGKVGTAMEFDGIDGVVELGKIDVVGQITLAAWIRADDFEINDARIITKAKEWGGNDHWWMLSTISETSLRFRLKTDDGQDTATLISDPALEAGVWAHVVASWDGSLMRLYKDGVEVASQDKGGSAVAVDPDVSAAIGSQPSDAFASDPSHVVKFFDGLIDEVVIYERALSEGEILYMAGFGEKENLVLNPSFEEDDVVLDDPDWYQWCTWNAPEGAGSNATIVDADSVDGGKSLMVEPIGVENWHFIVANISFPLSSGTDYTAAFWAKAESDRPLALQMKAADNSVSWGYTDFQLTTEWTQYTMTSTAESEEGKLEFFCAGTEVAFWLDLVSVYEAD